MEPEYKYRAFEQYGDNSEDFLPGLFDTPEEAWAVAEARYREDAEQWSTVNRGNPGWLVMANYGVEKVAFHIKDNRWINAHSAAVFNAWDAEQDAQQS